MRIKITENGPYIVTGNVPLVEFTIVYDKDGYSKEYKETKRYDAGETYSLCRCGKSHNKPFCDGTHIESNFSGTETAKREAYSDCAQSIKGPKASLTDYTELCAYARFCDSNGSTWGLVERTDDTESFKEFVKQCQHCPSGRLVAWDNKTGKPIEEKLTPMIALIEDPYAECSGPIWVRGGIVIESADGSEYEVRNRVTLCRCGSSHNKTFCDGTHASVKFRAK
jgi:CDGSH-type Zn-finger protein